MSNSFRKVIAIVCGLLLAAGIAFCIYTKDDQLITTVAIFGIVYIVYLIVFIGNLKKSKEQNKTVSPLQKRK